jgi:ribosomal protein S18 acetylase RimI-like enzyme
MEGARVALNAYAEAHNEDARALFTRCGFQDIRSSYWMRIDFEQPPQPPQAIPGIRIRSIQGDAEERAALQAAHESFKDHWGHIDEPFDAFYERQMYFIRNSTVYDPSLWFIALDGEEIAGVSLCRSFLDGSPDMGWVNTLGVRRPWRKRGIGQALLQHSFCELHRRGRTSTGLGVDASSLTGATRLYEKAGMRVTRKATLYEMELRPGEDLRTNTIA